MKKLLIIIGILFSLVGIFQTTQYIFDYNILSEYGKGYIWGSSILLALGLFTLTLGIRLKKQDKKLKEKAQTN